MLDLKKKKKWKKNILEEIPDENIEFAFLTF